MIKKEALVQAIDLISELNLNNEDFEIIFKEFNNLLGNSELKEKLTKINGLNEIKKEDNLKKLMLELSDKLSLKELNFLLKIVIKNEKFVNFIQDLFLEKLI